MSVFLKMYIILGKKRRTNIDATSANDNSGFSIALSSNAATVTIGSYNYSGTYALNVL